MDPQPASGNRSGAIRGVAFCAAFLAATILATTCVTVDKLKESALAGAETNLFRRSLILAEQAERAIQSLDLVLSDVQEDVQRAGVVDSESYRRRMNGYETHLRLQEKMVGIAQIDAVTMIDVDGNLINFSRYWPIPTVNVADRDYFAAIKSDPRLGLFISRPVRNRGDNTWNIYLARRVSGSRAFVGLILGALKVSYFEDFYKAIAIDDANAVSLIRRDGTLLVHYPPSPLVGATLSSDPQSEFALATSTGVGREVSPVDGRMRIRSARLLKSYPLLVLTTQTEDSALAQWRNTSHVLAFVSAVGIAVITLAALVIGLWLREQENVAATRAERAEAERVRALAQAELGRQREEAAQAASRAKSLFLATMSHEIRTPMNALLGLASTLLEGKLEPEQRASVAAIHDAGDNLLRILNDVLDFSKLEAGRLEFEQAPFSPEALVDNVLSIVGPRAAIKGLALRVETGPAPPPVLVGDRGRLGQVLLNLLSNAVKFTAAGEVVVRSRCLTRSDTHATMEWVVRDTGIGIAPDRIGPLFGEFVQADPSIHRRYGGTGLGLAICRRIVEQMGGDIGVASTPGKGTTFHVRLTLPWAQAGGVEPPDHASAADLHAALARFGRTLRVLLAEDNPTNQMVVIKMLAEFDIEVTKVSDGAQAVVSATRSSYDLILMDMRMPELDGIEAARAIRARGGDLSRVPIIAASANAYADDVKACRDAGMTGFVAKPVRKRHLIEAILQAMQAQAPQAADAPDGSGRDAPPPGPRRREQAIIDLAALDTLAEELGHDDARAIWRAFVTETEERLRRMQALSCTDEPHLVRGEAHTLKGAAGTFGLGELAAAARALEQEAERCSPDDYRTALARLAAAFDRARHAMPAAYARAA